MSVKELLNRNGIRLKSYEPDQHASTCPICSHIRKPENINKPCLSVLIDDDGATWNCKNCELSGPSSEWAAAYANAKQSKRLPPDDPLGPYHYDDGTIRKRRLPHKAGERQEYVWEHIELDPKTGRSRWVPGAVLHRSEMRTAGGNLYRGADIAAAVVQGRTIYIPEGEKDVCTFLQFGGTAISGAHGSDTDWSEIDLALFTGADVVVVPDKGAAGRKYRDAACLCVSQTAKRVRVLDLEKHWPEMADNQDVTDWLKAGGGHTRARLKKLIDDAPNYVRPEGAEPPAPDLSVLRPLRRAAPRCPVEVFGPQWEGYFTKTAKLMGCQVDYVVAPGLAVVSNVIGNARWVQAWGGWAEPPHGWFVGVGMPGIGKGPGSDPFFKNGVVQAIEADMRVGFAERLQQALENIAKKEAEHAQWKAKAKRGEAGPFPDPVPEPPIEPRFSTSDATVEKVALILAGAAPKGLLMKFDELSRWLSSMGKYSAGNDRAFWLESHGGREYTRDRVGLGAKKIIVKRLVVSLYGGIQPDRIAAALVEVDDGLLERAVWFWPEAIPFKSSRGNPPGEAVEWCKTLAALNMAKGPDGEPTPVVIPLAKDAADLLEQFAERASSVGLEIGEGLMCSQWLKARGMVLRLSLIIELMWWCAAPKDVTRSGDFKEPTEVSKAAVQAAIKFAETYALPMAERVFGDAATSNADRGELTLARYIAKERPKVINTRVMYREVRLPGLRTAPAIHEACERLVEAAWLQSVERGGGYKQGRPTATYAIDSRLYLALEPNAAEPSSPNSVANDVNDANEFEGARGFVINGIIGNEPQDRTADDGPAQQSADAPETAPTVRPPESSVASSGDGAVNQPAEPFEDTGPAAAPCQQCGGPDGVRGFKDPEAVVWPLHPGCAEAFFADLAGGSDTPQEPRADPPPAEDPSAGAAVATPKGPDNPGPGKNAQPPVGDTPKTNGREPDTTLTRRSYRGL